MVLFNYSTRELTAKIVYYGPGICGKTTNLQFIHENLPGDVRGKMLSLATKTDRTLFFDFLPIDLGEIRGMKTRVQLYTVPGQVFYNETRKLVLKGVDGIVFVADSQETMLGANLESFKNLEENLKAHGMKLGDMPHVIQFNKRDLPKLSSIEDMNSALNKFNAPFYESVATTGIGVQDTLKAIVKLVLLNLTRKYESKSAAEPAVAAVAAPAAPPVAAPAAVAAATVGAGAAASAPRASIAVSTDAAPSMAETQRVVVSEPPAEQKSEVRRAGKGKGKSAGASVPPPVQTMPPFEENEIDGLVGEVEDVEISPATTPTGEVQWLGAPIEDLLNKPAAPPDPGEFEVDHGFDPEWARPAAAAPSPAPPMQSVAQSAPMPAPAAHRDDADQELRLTEVATDDDLFSDPTLEIAHLTDGEAREIIVPVMLGDGPHAKRFKLAIRLRLHAVD